MGNRLRSRMNEKNKEEIVENHDNDQFIFSMHFTQFDIEIESSLHEYYRSHFNTPLIAQK